MNYISAIPLGSVADQVPCFFFWNLAGFFGISPPCVRSSSLLPFSCILLPYCIITTGNKPRESPQLTELRLNYQKDITDCWGTEPDKLIHADAA
jgi:hypothetical protein